MTRIPKVPTQQSKVMDQGLITYHVGWNRNRESGTTNALAEHDPALHNARFSPLRDSFFAESVARYDSIPDEPGWHGVREALAGFAFLLLFYFAAWLWLSIGAAL